MQTYFTARRSLWILCLLAMPALTGCYTTAGFGRDIQQLGGWIEGGAQETASWVYGSEAQAAEMQSQDPPAQAADTGDEGQSPEQLVIPAAGGNVVYFRTGSAEIPSDAMEMIREIAANGIGQGSGGGRIEVVGYTDSAGPAELNERLSQERAEAVADELAAQGIPRESIVVEWRGEDELPVETGDGVHEPQNRRVAISMMGT